MKRYKWITVFLLTTAQIQADLSNPSALELEETDFHVILDPLHKAILSAQISSPIVKIFKKLGDSFNQGDLILKLDDSIYEASFQKAKAVLDRATSVYEAKKELFDAKIASLSEYKEAYALYATAQSEFELAKKQLAACYLIAPYRGKVANVNLYEHELPQVGQPLAEIVGDEVLLAKMLVDAKFLNQLEVGRPIAIHVKEINQSLPARIKRVGSVIDPASSTITVEAEIDNIDRELMAGMTGTTSFSEIPSNENPIAFKTTIEPIDYSGSILDDSIAQTIPFQRDSNKKLQAIEIQYQGKLTYRLGKKTSLPDPKPPIVFNGSIRDELEPKFNYSENFFKEPITHAGNADITHKLGSLPAIYPKEPLFTSTEIVEALNEKSNLPLPFQTSAIYQESALNSELDAKSKLSTGKIESKLTTESSLSNIFENSSTLPKPLMPIAFSHESAFSDALDHKASLAKKSEYKPLSIEKSLTDISQMSSLPEPLHSYSLVFSSGLKKDLDEKSKIYVRQDLTPLHVESSFNDKFDQKTQLPQPNRPSILTFQGLLEKNIQDKTALLRKIETIFFARYSDLQENLSDFFAYKEKKKIPSISFQGDLMDLSEKTGEIALIDYPLAPPIEDFSKKPAVKKLSTKSPIREHLIFQPWEESIGSSGSSGKRVE